MSALSSLIDHETTDRRFASLRGVAPVGELRQQEGSQKSAKQLTADRRSLAIGCALHAGAFTIHVRRAREHALGMP